MMSLLPALLSCFSDDKQSSALTEKKPAIEALTTSDVSYDLTGKTIQEVTDMVITGDLPFEQAMTPNTPYTLQQTCNKLWYENVDIADRYCADSPFFIPHVAFSTPNVVGKFTYLPVWKDLASHEQINAFLKTALDRASLDLGDKSPLVSAKWKIQPNKITIRVLPPGPASYKFFTARKAHAGGHFKISVAGETTSEITIGGTEFAKGSYYLSSVLAHELNHLYLKMSGQQSKITDQEDEIKSFDIQIALLEKYITQTSDPAEKVALTEHLETEKLYRSTFTTSDIATRKKGTVIVTLEANRDMLLFLEHIGEDQSEEAKKIRMLISALEKEI